MAKRRPRAPPSCSGRSPLRQPRRSPGPASRPALLCAPCRNTTFAPFSRLRRFQEFSLPPKFKEIILNRSDLVLCEKDRGQSCLSWSSETNRVLTPGWAQDLMMVFSSITVSIGSCRLHLGRTCWNPRFPRLVLLGMAVFVEQLATGCSDRVRKL